MSTPLKIKITHQLLLTVAGVLMLVASAYAAPVQWTVASGGNGHLYDLTPTRMNWDQAQAYAVSQGGTLVSINSQAEQDFLLSTFFTGANDKLIAWIGLTDAASEANFVWLTGEPLIYTNWEPAEPNNFGDEDYGVINWHYANNFNTTKGTWNDVHIGGTTTPLNPNQILPYFGLIETVPIPEPATTLLLIGGTATLLGCIRSRFHIGS